VRLENDYRIQSSILSSFFFASFYGERESDIYKLDPSIFVTPILARMAEKINECAFYELDFALHKIEEACVRKPCEIEVLDVLSATPLPLKTTRFYYDNQVKKAKFKLVL